MKIFSQNLNSVELRNTIRFLTPSTLMEKQLDCERRVSDVFSLNPRKATVKLKNMYVTRQLGGYFVLSFLYLMASFYLWLINLVQRFKTNLLH